MQFSYLGIHTATMTMLG